MAELHATVSAGLKDPGSAGANRWVFRAPPREVQRSLLTAFQNRDIFFVSLEGTASCCIDEELFPLEDRISKVGASEDLVVSTGGGLYGC